MKQFLPFLLLCVSVSLSAQTVSHTFHDEPLAQALEPLQSHQQTYRITFIHNELKDLKVTATLKGLSVPEAVERICKGLPVRVKVKDTDIFVQY